jgi:hypothetical protein
MFAPAGEVSVNSGGEPERDEPGLPPVDIEIPDDARELERDVQAYFREQRALRRRRRTSRWHRSLGRDGIVLPLLACCLILALIAGTLLTVFTATSDQNQTGGVPGGSGSAAPATFPAGLLPRAVLAVGGGSPIRADSLTQAMLVLVPANCNCSATLGWLADVAVSAHVHAAYLVYTPAAKASVQQMYGQLSSRRQAALTLAEEKDGVLTSPARIPAGIPAHTLTAILVARDRGATYASRLSPADDPATLIHVLTS